MSRAAARRPNILHAVAAPAAHLVQADWLARHHVHAVLRRTHQRRRRTGQNSVEVAAAAARAAAAASRRAVKGRVGGGAGDRLAAVVLDVQGRHVAARVRRRAVLPLAGRVRIVHRPARRQVGARAVAGGSGDRLREVAVRRAGGAAEPRVEVHAAIVGAVLDDERGQPAALVGVHVAVADEARAQPGRRDCVQAGRRGRRRQLDVHA
mmetsp:Transcript_60449/g.179676  ORF Transcript_60449/g.179676 Transcript_60449/m.179676 type:complete len:208 (+) Transcript_60449:2705-3328(+)